MKAGYYWVKIDPVEDWEPAMFTGEWWVFLGSEIHEEAPPAVIGDLVTSP